MLLDLGIRELMFNLDQDEKIDLLRKAYEKECIVKAKDLAYNILKLEKAAEEKSKEIEFIKSKIKGIIKDIPYILDEKYIKDGIKDIFDSILKDN